MYHYLIPGSLLRKTNLVYLLFFAVLVGHSVALFAQTDSLENKTLQKKKMSLKDPEDGAIDLSEFLESASGFLPVPVIITEPAVGYGGGLALCFFHPHKGKGGKSVTPDITGVAGLGTQNRTWLVGAFHRHVFGDDRVRTLTAIAKPNVRIKYYGNNNEYLSKNPVTLKMDSWIALQNVQVRLGATRWYAGLSYTFFQAETSLDTIPGRPLLNLILERLKGTSTISMIEPRINFDNRDNIFTPTKGFDAGLIFTYNATWLGADDDFYSLNPYFLGYVPIARGLYSSWRFDGKYLIGDAPLYAYPFVSLRGIPAMRYQSDNTMVFETEWRYEFYRRWSVSAFSGGGKAFESVDNFDNIDWAYTIGTGIRYKLAKAFGMHTGLDFAWGNAKDFAFYIVVGSSWNK
jgi:hypothetical protein